MGIRGARAGHTLAELLVALVIVAVAASLAVPSFSGVIARMRVRAALDVVSADLYYARMMGIRSGYGAVVRLERGPCRPGYRIVVRGTAERLARVRRVGDVAVGVCLMSNNSDTIAFNSRGLPVPFTNRTVRAIRGGVRDSLTLSTMGRVYRRF